MVEPSRESSNLSALLGVSANSSSSDEAPISTSRCAERDESSDDSSGDEKLPSPTGLDSAFPSKKRKGDDPALHQGRKRKVKHVEGDYATRTYIPIELSWDGFCNWIMPLLLPPAY